MERFRPMAVAIASSAWGTTRDGTAVEAYTLTSETGVSVTLLTYGGIVQQVLAPDRRGELSNVVLGFPTLADYVERNSPYFGALIGRYANRIANATFALDGVRHQVPPNDGSNALHGGTTGFDRRVWQASEVRPDDGSAGVELRYASPDGEMGFPGTLSVAATYTLDDEGALRLDFEATTDRPTVLNLTNHSYWNLAGEGSGTIADHVLTVHADRYLRAGEALLPTGELASVAGTPLDFRQPRSIGARLRDGVDQLVLARGYDHCFAVDGGGAGTLVRAAHLHEPTSGRVLDVLTTEPGIQVYSGNFLDGTLVGSSGRTYRQGDGLALEAQHFPDSPNQPGFPSTVLGPGEVFRSTTVFRLSTDAAGDGG
jgi:aldose 1-epimerase